eukprot:6194317-Pleurochrysis_carterae.AAC.1
MVAYLTSFLYRMNARPDCVVYNITAIRRYCPPDCGYLDHLALPLGWPKVGLRLFASSGAAAPCRLRCCVRRRALPYSAHRASTMLFYLLLFCLDSTLFLDSRWRWRWGASHSSSLSLVAMAGWSGSSPEPDRVRGGVFGYQYLSFTHYNSTRGGRSSLGPGSGSAHMLGLCVPLAGVTQETLELRSAALGPSGYIIPKSTATQHHALFELKVVSPIPTGRVHLPTLAATFAFANTEPRLFSSIVGSPPTTVQQAKYQDTLCSRHLFTPLILEVFGGFACHAQHFIH